MNKCPNVAESDGLWPSLYSPDLARFRQINTESVTSRSRETPSDSGPLRFFRLQRAEQEVAVRRMAADGLGDHEIAQLTGWHVQSVRQCLAQEVRP